MSAPPNFSWIIEKKLAGSGYPRESNFKWLYDNGIRAIVNLTERPYDSKIIEKFKFRYLHLPIPDFGVPTVDEAKQYVKFVDEMISKGYPTLTHCIAGCGRTGMMLAIYLVHLGYSADDAIYTIRKLRPCSIESWLQEDFVYEFALTYQKYR
ncbi:MAG: dual specificity protein phosphatase 23 [Candidatus Asgardarchaeia archaeon]